VLSVVAAAVIVIVVSVAAGAWPYRVFGTSDPGPVVRVGTPLLRLVVDVAAAACTGALVFAAFFTRAQPSGLVSPPAYAALRTATRSATVWALAALLLWPFDAAATAGLPLRRVLTIHGLTTLTDTLEGPRAWLLTAAVTAVLAVACRRTLRWQPTLLLAGLAGFALLPPLAVGHSASDTGHDLATAAIMIHVPVAMVWLGTLVALLRARAMGADAEPAVRRYRRMAAGCWLVVAFSGLVDAAVLAPGSTPFTTGYGLLLMAKVAVLVGLAWITVRWRRAVTRAGRPGGRLLAVELVVLTVTFGLSVALTHLPAPKFIGRLVTGEQTLLGYNLGGAPTALRLAVDWRVEVLFAPLCAILAAAYLFGVRRLRRTGTRWPAGRTAAWLAGCAVLLVATSSGLGRYAPAMFSVQAAAHMLVGMVAPALFALGAPLSLASQGLRPAAAGQLPGPREWLAGITDSAVIRLFTQPLVAAAIFVGAPFLLYFTPAYGLTIRYHWAHLAMDAVFLVVGYLFAWLVVGPDPVPRPMPGLMRVGLLLAVMPADIAFGAAVIGSRQILGDGHSSGNLYTALALPWVADLAGDQRLGGYLVLAIGEACVLALLAVLIARWRPAAGDDLGGDYQPIIDVLAHRTAAGRLDDQRLLPVAAQRPQPQAVGDHQQRGQRHGGAGDQRVEQAGGGDR
jgi:putative copper resistance protein D